MSTPQINVLIIEDDAILAENLKEELEAESDQIKVIGLVVSGEHGLDIYKRKNPEVVLIDFYLYNGNGTWNGAETARKIKESGDPIIIFCSHIDDTYEKVKGVAPDNFLNKPYQAKKIWRAIELAVKKRTSIAQLNDPPSPKDTIVIKTLKFRQVIRLSEMLYVKSNLGALEFFMINEDKHIVHHRTLRSFMEEMEGSICMQISQAYAVNIDAIDKFDKNFNKVFLKKEIELEIQPKYKPEVKRRMDRFN